MTLSIMKKQLFILCISCLSFVSFAQMAQNPVSWIVSYHDLKNGEGELVYTANIEPKWHIYSQRATDAGPIPTTFSVTVNKNFTLLGKVEEQNAHEEYVKAFEAKVFVFEKQAIFKQKIKRLTKTPFKIKSTVEYMTCNDSQCLPPKTIELDITVPK